MEKVTINPRGVPIDIRATNARGGRSYVIETADGNFRASRQQLRVLTNISPSDLTLDGKLKGKGHRKRLLALAQIIGIGERTISDHLIKLKREYERRNGVWPTIQTLLDEADTYGLRDPDMQVLIQQSIDSLSIRRDKK